LVVAFGKLQTTPSQRSLSKAALKNIFENEVKSIIKAFSEKKRWKKQRYFTEDESYSSLI